MLQNAIRKGVTYSGRQPWSCRVSSIVSPAHWQRGRGGLTGYVRAANKCLNGRVGPKKGSVYRQTGWHHPDNGAARGSPILHLTSPKHNHKKTHPLAHADMLLYSDTHLHRHVTYSAYALKLCIELFKKWMPGSQTAEREKVCARLDRCEWRMLHWLEAWGSTETPPLLLNVLVISPVSS